MLSNISDDFMEDFPLDPLLAVHEPKKVMGKGRSSGSPNEDKSTTRNPSGFEYTEVEFSQLIGEDTGAGRREDKGRGRSRKHTAIRKQRSVENVESGSAQGRGRGRGRGRGQGQRVRGGRGREQAVDEESADIAGVPSSLIQF